MSESRRELFDEMVLQKLYDLTAIRAEDIEEDIHLPSFLHAAFQECPAGYSDAMRHITKTTHKLISRLAGVYGVNKNDLLLDAEDQCMSSADEFIDNMHGEHKSVEEINRAFFDRYLGG